MVVHRAIVTGGAGFIGSHFVDKLLGAGWKVLILDNFRTGRMKFLEHVESNPNLEIQDVDLLSNPTIDHFFRDTKRVYHLSANADVRFGPRQPTRDLEQNTIVTQKVLEASRKSGVEEFVFSSTGSVYGEAKIIPTPEDAPFPLQTSLYGASKLAGEGLVQAYAEAFGIKSWIFRFVSILGPRYSHGHIFDFYRQLRANPTSLVVMGNGFQKKSYLHVDDCVNAVEVAIHNSRENVQIFNLGTDEFCEVKDSVRWICDELGLSPQVEFGTENRGWIGDNPFIYLKTEKIKQLGWAAKFDIETSVRATTKYLNENQWLFGGKQK